MGEKHDVSCRGHLHSMQGLHIKCWTLLMPYTLLVKCLIRRVDYTQLTLDSMCVWDIIGHGCGEFRGCRFWHRGVIKDWL